MHRFQYKQVCNQLEIIVQTSSLDGAKWPAVLYRSTARGEGAPITIIFLPIIIGEHANSHRLQSNTKVWTISKAPYVINSSVVVKTKIQRPRTRPRPGPSRPRPRGQGLDSRGQDQDQLRPGPFKTKTKARTLESKANFKAKYDSQFNAKYQYAIDMTIAPIS